MLKTRSKHRKTGIVLLQFSAILCHRDSRSSFIVSDDDSDQEFYSLMGASQNRRPNDEAEPSTSVSFIFIWLFALACILGCSKDSTNDETDLDSDVKTEHMADVHDMNDRNDPSLPTDADTIEVQVADVADLSDAHHVSVLKQFPLHHSHRVRAINGRPMMNKCVASIGNRSRGQEV